MTGSARIDKEKLTAGQSGTRWSMILLAIVFMTGCGQNEIGEAEYGKRIGTSVGRSVNGTTVLGDMFDAAGCRVRSVATLGRVVDRADVVVWFPDRFRPPEDKVREHLEEWLQSETGRTLIYVGRDFDAEATYWNSVVATAPPDQRIQLRLRLAKARARHARARSGFPAEEDCDWFKLDRNQPTRTITTLAGPFSRGIDSAKTDIRVGTRYSISDKIKDSKKE